MIFSLTILYRTILFATTAVWSPRERQYRKAVPSSRSISSLSSSPTPDPTLPSPPFQGSHRGRRSRSQGRWPGVWEHSEAGSWQLHLLGERGWQRGVQVLRALCWQWVNKLGRLCKFVLFLCLCVTWLEWQNCTSNFISVWVKAISCW